MEPPKAKSYLSRIEEIDLSPRTLATLIVAVCFLAFSLASFFIEKRRNRRRKEIALNQQDAKSRKMAMSRHAQECPKRL